MVSQFATLEPLEQHENGIVIDVDEEDIDFIVDTYVARTTAEKTDNPGKHHSRRWPGAAEPVAAGWQLILAALAGLSLIVVLITVVKLHPFLALIFGGLTVGIVAGETSPTC